MKFRTWLEALEHGFLVTVGYASGYTVEPDQEDAIDYVDVGRGASEYTPGPDGMPVFPNYAKAGNGTKTDIKSPPHHGAIKYERHKFASLDQAADFFHGQLSEVKKDFGDRIRRLLNAKRVVHLSLSTDSPRVDYAWWNASRIAPGMGAVQFGRAAPAELRNKLSNITNVSNPDGKQMYQQWRRPDKKSLKGSETMVD
jgi:hypothetical protein